MLRVTQGKLFTKPKSLPAQSRDYDARNLEIAQQFIADPSLCGGPKLHANALIAARIGSNPFLELVI